MFLSLQITPAACPHHLYRDPSRENPDHYFFNERGAHGPIISIKGYEKGDDDGKIVDDDVEFEVSVEGNQLCLVKDFMVAFQIYLESYNIFNISYPKGLENTLLFFQKYIINICDDGIKISTRVLSLIMKAKNSFVRNQCF